MADNTQIIDPSVSPGGDIIATDDIGGVKYQRIKIVHGADGVNSGDVASGNPLPVSIGNYFFEISRGNVSGASTITKFGLNDDVDAISAEDIWGTGGVYVAPTAARIHNIASSSASDTAAGTGARTVLLRGIDGSYNAVSETVTLNGVSNVATVNSYFHIHLMQVITGGSGGANAGDITAIAQTDATETCRIPIGLNQSVSSIYMVPVGYKGYIMKCRARMTNGTANSGAIVQLLNKPFGGVFQLKTQMGLNNAGTSFVCLDYTNSTPFIVQAKSLTKLKCSQVTNNNTSVEGEYDLILIQD